MWRLYTSFCSSYNLHSHISTLKKKKSSPNERLSAALPEMPQWHSLEIRLKIVCALITHAPALVSALYSIGETEQCLSRSHVIAAAKVSFTRASPCADTVTNLNPSFLSRRRCVCVHVCIALLSAEHRSHRSKSGRQPSPMRQILLRGIRNENS